MVNPNIVMLYMLYNMCLKIVRMEMYLQIVFIVFFFRNPAYKILFVTSHYIYSLAIPIPTHWIFLKTAQSTKPREKQRKIDTFLGVEISKTFPPSNDWCSFQTPRQTRRSKTRSCLHVPNWKCQRTPRLFNIF